MYIMLCGYPPFNGKTKQGILKAVQKGKYKFNGEEWDEVSNEAKDLINELLNKDYKKRISGEEALLHPWIKRYNKKSRISLPHA